MKRNELARFKQVIVGCANWLMRVNQNQDGSFKDSLSIGCIFEMSQAVVALLKFSRLEKNQEALDSAIKCGEWILKQQVKSKDKHADGNWVTPEYGKGIIVVADTVETLWGLLELYRHTGRKKYLQSALRGFKTVQSARFRSDQTIWVSKGGIRSRIHLDYNPRTREYSLCLHRITDDAIWYLLSKLTRDPSLLGEFRALCNEQMRYQTSDGGFYETYFSTHSNNIMVAGARWSVYWAAYPYFYAYQEFKDRKYLQVIERSCNWLAARQEKDGSFYAWYYANGEVASDSIDSCSPSVAIIIWSKYMKTAKSGKYLLPCRRAVSWLTRNGDVAHYRERAPQLGVGSAERTGLFNTRSAAFVIRAYYDLRALIEH